MTNGTKLGLILAVTSIDLLLAQQPLNPKPHTATLSWTQGAPANVGDCAITSNNIYRGTASNQETLLLSIPVATSYADTTVQAGNTYFYKVSAVSCTGESPLSNEVNATIPHKPGEVVAERKDPQ